jgi:uncharacterized membrane protein
MTSLNKPRIESIDLLKGLVMVIMALDHVRDYFHFSAFYFDPADPVQSTLPVFFTRWITHFCAPAFSFLAGISAFMVGKRKTQAGLSRFLLSRGIWLIFIELTIVTFAWLFDVQFRTLLMVTLWSLGVSMIVLAVLIYLPRKVILIFSCVLIFGHNLFDAVHFDGHLLWQILHEQAFYKLSDHVQLLVGYPVIPWIAVMSLGYYFGSHYDQSVDSASRQKRFNIIGISALVLFIILRWTNAYGNPAPFIAYPVFSGTIISFFNPSKYPPSLQYLLMTLGVTFLFLANSEKWKGRIVSFFALFGRVPFFYYIIHLYVIHVWAMLLAGFTGFGWQFFILPTWIGFVPNMNGYGVGLLMVYIIWIAIILLLYPLCRWFDRYKQNHKDKWWLSYL